MGSYSPAILPSSLLPPPFPPPLLSTLTPLEHLAGLSRRRVVDKDFRRQRSDQEPAPKNLTTIIAVLLLYLAGGGRIGSGARKRQSGAECVKERNEERLRVVALKVH